MVQRGGSEKWQSGAVMQQGSLVVAQEDLKLQLGAVMGGMVVSSWDKVLFCGGKILRDCHSF